MFNFGFLSFNHSVAHMSAFFSKSSLNCRRKMADFQPLLNDHQQDDEELQHQQHLIAAEKKIGCRIASLDVFRGLSIFVSFSIYRSCLIRFSLDFRILLDH